MVRRAVLREGAIATPTQTQGGSMKLSTLKTTFEAIFDRDAIAAAVKRVGAIERERKVTAFAFILALVTGGCVGPTRTIAATRRSWEALTGKTFSDDAFEAHFNPGRLRLLWQLLHAVMKPSHRALRRQWPAPMRDLHDILVIDGSRMAVDAALSEVLRRTTPGQSALKLLGIQSLGDGQLRDVRAGAAVHHDRK